MLTVQIKNGVGKVIATINNIYSLTIDEEVNKVCKIKLRFPVEDWLQKNPIEKADRITIAYGLKIGQVVRLFEGYITDITLRTTDATIEAENWLAYLQYRMLRSNHNYENKPIKEVISELFTELNNTYPIPLTLGKNDCETTITKEFEVGETFYDILRYCWESEPKLVVRIMNKDGQCYLEAMQDGGEVIEGVREFDVNNVRSTAIVDWSWKDSLDDFYTYIKTENSETSNDDFHNDKKLIFEKYDKEGSGSLPSGVALPSITISRDTDWRDFYVGDRKNIRIFTGYEWLNLEYLGLIQSRKLTINAQNDIKAEIKITEEFKADTNILDLILQNLRKKK